MNRRNFLTTTAGTCGLLLLKPQTAFGYPANSAVRWGLLGCGRRGTAVATSFAKNAGVHITALADLFPDQLSTANTTFNQLNTSMGIQPIAPKRLFHGPEAFQALAACGEVDAIQISTPPFFHVEHLDVVTSAGKHAYCEKPIGVDIPQTRRALDIAKRIDGKLSVDVGFQIRSAPPFVELVRRIHTGQIGRIATIDAHYNAPPAVTFPSRAGMSRDELRLRNWLWDRNLSGDILLEQNIHVIDICNWVMGTHPTRATARASRKVIQNSGNTNDNYEVIFTYGGVSDNDNPSGLNSIRPETELTFSSTQFNAGNYFDVTENIFGTEGLAEAPYTGPLRILGNQPWAWQTTNGADNKSTIGTNFAGNGAFSDNLAEADSTKDRTFIESITSGRFHNQIVAGVQTARTCIMARKSAETGHPVTWSEIEADTETYTLGMDLKQFA